ncbi:Hsp70 family protein [Actinophytocola sp.]|uniref:Hsp70 family protein n=1 Tax=Actinophytocola sp. TaxID=1872138 RepID=UPI002D6A170E|nr:Hsp70 family protein [Actinophytocola sp.]HYQ66039.1 Hsp70 family protein [Actinophytocola sp.]
MTLVIDFGTVNTVGMVDGRLVTVDGAPWLPSVVHSGVVGADASLLGRGQESRNLKATLEPTAVGAVFARMMVAARAEYGEFGPVVVTHPADWTPSRVAVLARAAGVAEVHTFPDPVAVAAPFEETVLVVDAGGGTWDAAVVRDRSVVAAVTMAVDVDQRIVERVRPSLSEPVKEDATRVALLESARAGKELLSRHDVAEIVLPDHRAVRLTRAEFELLITPDVNGLMAAVSEVTSDVTVTRALLVGGCSRIPLLTLRLNAATGLPVLTDPEPESAVARGATLLTRDRS